MNPSSAPPVIYNLFPRFFTSIDKWIEEVPRIAAMGFSHIFVNPFHETGFSGSLYAVKDYYRLNPLFLGKGQNPSDFSPIERFNRHCIEHGMGLIVDLVINHTAIDSVLTREHARWYKRDEVGKLLSPFAIDPSDATKVTVWGDLASIDNENSSDREGLWAFWDRLIAFFQKRGINGFRCDAAYQVPVQLWKFLISSARKRDSRARFFAETLGCRLEQVEALAPAGFDYLFNSVKWWNYDSPWAIEQHETHRRIAPSIAFPESHDTGRLSSEPPGTLTHQKSRYAFAALFSEGLLMPMGYEYGATTRMDVVRGTPADVDSPKWDLSPWIGRMNALKRTVPVLAEEGRWKALNPFSQPFLFLEKSSGKGSPAVFVCVNKQRDAETVIDEWMVPERIRNCGRAISLLNDDPVWEPMPLAFTLDPADVVMFSAGTSDR